MHAEKSVYFRDINSYPDSLPNCNCILGYCGNFTKIKITVEESVNSLPNKTIIYHIFKYILKLSNHVIQDM